MSRPLPPDFIARSKTMQRREMLRHYRVGAATFGRWLRAAGLPVSTRAASSLRPVPDDFVEYASVLANNQLRSRYGAADVTIDRWRDEAGVPVPPGLRVEPAIRPMPADFRQIAPTITQTAATIRWQATDKTVRRWAREAEIHFRQGRRWSSGPGVATAPAADPSLAGRAADHLRRFYTPVYRAEILPAAERKHLPAKGKDMFVVGRKGALPAADIIAMAESRGFDPRAWARI